MIMKMWKRKPLYCAAGSTVGFPIGEEPHRNDARLLHSRFAYLSVIISKCWKTLLYSKWMQARAINMAITISFSHTANKITLARGRTAPVMPLPQLAVCFEVNMDFVTFKWIDKCYKWCQTGDSLFRFNNDVSNDKEKSRAVRNRILSHHPYSHSFE